jgi:hypothetical protein
MLSLARKTVEFFKSLVRLYVILSICGIEHKDIQDFFALTANLFSDKAQNLIF